MKKKMKIGILIGSVLLFVISILILYKSTQQVVYIEYINTSQNYEEIFYMNHNDDILEQEFTIPYQMFCGLGFSVGTYERKNNSRYELTVIDKTLNQTIISQELNSSIAEDGQILKVMFDSPIRVDITHQFSVTVKAKTKVNSENAIGFYADSKINQGKLLYNDTEKNANLCMNIYGGNANTFQFMFTLGCEIYILFLIFYSLYLYVHQKSIKKSPMVQAGLLGILVFCLLAAVAKIENFGDEIDNIIGGMLIAKGNILYVDYYTQHTPFAYFLCAVFSLFQAGSVLQFRLIYYVCIAFIYIGLYLRHKDNFGKIGMILLPILQITFGILLEKQTIMILSDNIQAICMIALVLEFLQYLKDKKLDWKRALIVSLSIFCSFTSAFVSLYAIFAIVLGVFISEIKYWKERKDITFKKTIQRYGILIISCAIPFILLLVYLLSTNSLERCYEQAFQFNTEVYSRYSMIGSHKIQPFFLGITNFLQIFSNALQQICQGKNILLSIVSIILAATFLKVILEMIHRKEYRKSITLFLFVSFGFCREYLNFHAIASWASMITILIVSVKPLFKENASTQILKIIGIILAVLLAGNYAVNATHYPFKEKEPILETERRVISQTTEGEEIFLDIISDYSVFLIYKNRRPINRLGFILTWYLEWYELDTIEDLERNQPKLVIYDEMFRKQQMLSGDDYLTKYLYENYEKMEEDNKIWLKKQ